MTDIDTLIEKLDLQPHPEGGYFRETYRSSGQIDSTNLPMDISGTRNYATCIYFLLTSDNFSAFHKIKQDEIWHFYNGAPISLHILDQKGGYQKHLVGANLENGEMPQVVVKAGDWFSSEVESMNTYALAGCTVSPGFDFKDFEMASREALIEAYPEQTELIIRLTR